MNNKSIHSETTKRKVVLIAVIAMTFMATLDSSIVNVLLFVQRYYFGGVWEIFVENQKYFNLELSFLPCHLCYAV